MSELTVNQKQPFSPDKIKHIRYLITSIFDLKDVLNVVNVMFGQAERKLIEHLQLQSQISAIPLPDSYNRFVLCIEIPQSLLGADREKQSVTLDYTRYRLADNYINIGFSRRNASFSFYVKSSLDINIAINQFDAAVSCLNDKQQAVRIQQSLKVSLIPPGNGMERNELKLILPDIPPSLLDIISDNLNSSNLIRQLAPA